MVHKRVDSHGLVARIADVRGDWFGFFQISEQGTPVKFRDGPAAVCRQRSSKVDLIVRFSIRPLLVLSRCDAIVSEKAMSEQNGDESEDLPRTRRFVAFLDWGERCNAYRIGAMPFIEHAHSTRWISVISF